jgi:hypothetical protein
MESTSLLEIVEKSFFDTDFFIKTKFGSHKMTNNFKIKISFNSDPMDIYQNLQYSTGLSNTVQQTLFNHIKSLSNFECIDTRVKKFEIEYVINQMANHDKMIVDRSILREIQKDNRMEMYYNPSIRTENIFTLSGNLYGVEIWQESNFILDEVFGNAIITTKNPLQLEMDIKEIKLNNGYSTEFTIDIHIGSENDFKVWYIIESENDKNWDMFVQWNRENKIKNLID